MRRRAVGRGSHTISGLKPGKIKGGGASVTKRVRKRGKEEPNANRSIIAGNLD